MDHITIQDFGKVDIRIGTVKKAEVPEWSHWVIKLTIDFGSEIGEKIIFSGIMKFYKAKDLENKQFPFVVNLVPKKIGPQGDYSNGMLMAVSTGETEEDKPALFNLKEKVENGSKVL
ncbi:MAG TPA: methionine--tRNA ligase [Patescibacteria group bacterium]|nr:methionine--tRNA ligase [Patescibacteria group bacterium]